MGRALLIVLTFLLSFVSRAQTITITTPADTICHGTSATFTATVDSFSGWQNYQWYLNGLASESYRSSFITDTLGATSYVWCVLSDETGDTISVSGIDTIFVKATTAPSPIVTGMTPLCEGDSIHLTGTPAGGYWEDYDGYGNLDTSSTCNFIAAVYSDGGTDLDENDEICYRVNSTCSDSCVSIHVTPSPDAVFSIQNGIYINPPSCTGQSENYIVYGCPACGNFSLSFSNNKAILTGYGINYNMPGYDTITSVCTNTCGSGTFSMSIDILQTLDSTISPIFASATSVCENASYITLFDSSQIGAYSCSWTSNNGDSILSLLNETRLYGKNAGTSVVTVTIQNDCGIGSTSINLTILPPGPINTGPVVCTGKNWMSDIATGGTWQNKYPAIGHIDPVTGIYITENLGYDTITYTLDGCTVTSGIEVFQSPKPIIAPQYICMDSTAMAFDSSFNTGSYYDSWHSADQYIAEIDADGTIHGKHVGSTYLYFMLQDGCKDTSLIDVRYSINDIAIFPNPASDKIFLQTNPNLNLSYSLMDIGRKNLFTGPIINAITEIDISNLPAAFYLLDVYGVDGTFVNKIIKK